jgi:GNAT superfamily N-acetyltransferase
LIPRAAISIHRGYLPGCIGRITELHARFYAAHAGFGLYFEGKVARELAAFCTRYDVTRDGLWLAQQDDQIEGAVAVDGSHADTEGAHLRWFITSDALRGSGAGTQLLTQALAFCDVRGYRKVYLWTFEGLHAARHLYEKNGFRLAQQQPGRQWGTEVVEQRFERVR